MKKPPAAAVVLLTLLFALPDSSRACSMARTLWEMVEGADLVAVARVARIEADPTVFGVETEDAGDHEVAVLDVLDVWKGPSIAQVRLDFRSRFTTTRYREGAVVLVFLERGESRARRWREVTETAFEPPTPEEIEELGLDEAAFSPRELAMERQREEEEVRKFESWAAGRWLESGEQELPDSNEDRAVLERLVRDAARLQSAGKVSETDRLDWFIAAAAPQSLRRENVYALRAAETDLTDEQLGRIADILATAPALNETDLVLLQILKRHSGSEVDTAAAAVIEAALRMKPIPDWTTAMIEEALRRYGDDFSERVGRDDRDSSGRLIYMAGADETLPTIWAVARRDLGIPEVPPAERPPDPASSPIEPE